MKALFAALALVSTLLQGLIIGYWTQTAAPAEFLRFFGGFYGETPLWSQAAFAFGHGWLLVPLLVLAGLAAALACKSLRAQLGKLAAASLLLSAAMVYAMYPLHLIMGAMP